MPSSQWVSLTVEETWKDKLITLPIGWRRAHLFAIYPFVCDLILCR